MLLFTRAREGTRRVATLLGIAGAFGVASGVHAGYILTPVVNDADSVVVVPGEIFTVDIQLLSGTGEVHNSSLFQILFTEPGLEYLSYSWADPYDNGTIFDFSAPIQADLPAVIDGDLLPGGAGQSDIELSNVVPAGGTFSTGTLVSLELRVPLDWSGDEQLFIVPLPDTFANGFEEIETEPGAALSVTIIPAPMSGLLLVGGLPWAVRRRR